MVVKGFNAYIKRFDAIEKSFIPPKKEWTPPDQALYGVKNLFDVPVKEAEKLRFKAIKYSFKHNYENNSFYRKMCKERDVKPEDIKTEKDFLKIPLLPDKFFKDYPEGKRFAIWLSNIFTGDLPNVFVEKKKPTKDDIINAFNKAGLHIAYSSGTSGRHTFIPRDEKTFNRTRYASAKAVATMGYPNLDFDNVRGYISLYAENINLFVAVMSAIFTDVFKHVDYGFVINREITTDTLDAVMRGRKNLLLKLAALWIDKTRVRRYIKWLVERSNAKHDIALLGAPFFLNHLMGLLEKKGFSFDFGEHSFVMTGGGWKIREDARITTEMFRRKVEKVFGVPESNCLDVYGMVESNGFMIQCPEGHYLHIPYTYFYPIVLDKNGEPVGYGEKGRFAFLDSLATSYPGFIVSGDEVKLLEHCPVCDRPGPVLEPEVTRAKGEEVRGCAEELRRGLSISSGGR
ncbi:MAG: hypothetical protein FE035_01805 [Thermoplasmata archaeon]|nr:MAG: hypothetical protein FE035_01805 [Thermoplasmata archaeon]HDM25543.1 hypothetical protein [Thermoplasmatales archaeon]